MRTDAELLEASRRGERAAFGALVERYQRMVSAVSYSRTRDAALSEDVAQETFIAAWQRLDQLREPSRLRSWLCGIAKNLARKTRRRSDREVAEPELEIASVAGDPFEAVSDAQADKVVGEALARVPETYRDVLVLYYREQLSIREVADALGITEAAAMQRLSRGRQYLATGLSALVERSLRKQRGRTGFAAAVLAALPAKVVLTPSRVEASPSSHGGNMLKLGLAAAAFIGAATTVVVVTHRGDTPTATAAAPTEVASIVPGKPAAAPTLAPRRAQLPMPQVAAKPELPHRRLAAANRCSSASIAR